MSTRTPEPADDLPDDVPEADAADQRLSTGTQDEDGQSLPEEPLGLSDDANPADVWEQSQPVPDDEDERDEV
ncbi:hypothetical protein ASG73_02145 [Janibacter sp. Soil728]|uniref:hypothetical protein n=1 Tax=Janibacter sp. Soil728 TaxID=1736393 RepID=UPI0007011A0E|nr:hypothetical protein [Janibacter sp. Soil728]KRE39168.1 hypothetical protein ASG73_02145 [Janibacter sp. Soil728]